MLFKGHCPMCGGTENDIVKMDYEVVLLEEMGNVPIINLRCARRKGCHQFSVSGDGKCSTDILELIDISAEIPDSPPICST